jgi:hypothetical protein
MAESTTTTSEPAAAPAATTTTVPVAAPAPGPASVIAEAVAPPAPEAAPAAKSQSDTLYPADPGATALDADGKPVVAAVEPKLDADGKPIVEDPAKAAEPAAVAPEKYEAFKLPEGATLDEATTGSLTELARANNLTQDAAQSLVDLHFQSLKANMDSWVSGQTAAFDSARAELRTQQSAMPEMQGEERTHSLQTIGRMLDEFDTGREVRTILEHNLIGDHPAFIRMMLSIANTLVEGDTVPTGSAGKLAGPANGRALPKSAGDILYGN